MNQLFRLPNAGIVYALLDQGICSFSNFLTGVLCAKLLTVYDFGLYTLLFSTMISLNGLANALVSEPVRVFCVSVTAACWPAYLGTQIMFRLSIGLVCGLVAYMFVVYFGYGSPALGFVMAATVLCTQLQELLRVLYSARSRWLQMLLSDVCNHTVRIAAIAVLYCLDMLTLAGAIASIALGGLAGGLVACIGRPTLGLPGLDYFRDECARSLGYGKWIFFEAMVYIVSTQTYFYFISLMIDVPSVGAFGAVQSLANALNVLFMGLSSYATPVARRLLMQEGYVAWKSWLVRLAIISTAAIAIVAVLLCLFAEELLSLVYAPEYARYAFLMPAMGIILVMTGVDMALSIAFRTAGVPQVAFLAKCLSAVITLGAAYPLLHWLGILGAAVGLVLAQASWLLVYLWQITAGDIFATQRESERVRNLRPSF